MPPLKKSSERKVQPSPVFDDVYIYVNNVNKNNNDSGSYTPALRDLEYERFFEENSHSSSTSKNTLPDPNMLNISQYTELINKIPFKHEEEIDYLNKRYRSRFLYWHSDLRAGYNLCFYGYGSKMELIDEFAAYSNKLVIRIEGFNVNFNFQTTLELLNEIVEPISFKNIEEKIAQIKNYFSSDNRIYDSLLMVIHNLDGPTFRDTRNLNHLAELVSAPNIHLITSVDNINFPILLDHELKNKYNFIWYEITTFRSYTLN